MFVKATSKVSVASQCLVPMGHDPWDKALHHVE